jgi:hypothetical protein
MFNVTVKTAGGALKFQQAFEKQADAGKCVGDWQDKWIAKGAKLDAVDGKIKVTSADGVFILTLAVERLATPEVKRYAVWYSEGPGTTEYVSGRFDTLDEVDEHTAKHSSFHARFRVEQVIKADAADYTKWLEAFAPIYERHLAVYNRKAESLAGGLALMKETGAHHLNEAVAILAKRDAITEMNGKAVA